MLSIHHTGIKAFLNSFHALIGILHQQRNAVEIHTRYPAIRSVDTHCEILIIVKRNTFICTNDRITSRPRIIYVRTRAIEEIIAGEISELPQPPIGGERKD